MNLFDKVNPIFSIDEEMDELLNNIDLKLNDIKITDKQKRKYMVTKSKVRSIHSSLAIEANSLSLFDVENILEHKQIIGKRDEIQERLHIKRSALDSAILQLKECNLIKETKQGKNLPNIIYLGKTVGMIESEKLDKLRSAENQHSGKNETNSQECIKSAVQNNKNNKYINNNYNGYKNKKIGYKGRHYPDGFLENLYANKP